MTRKMETKLMTIWTVVFLLLAFGSAFYSAPADATCKYGCKGPPGEDGQDGIDGKDGKDGADGKDGQDGRDGIDGKDGEVPEEWITEVRNYNTNTVNQFNTLNKWNKSIREAAAASASMQVNLPQDKASRLTFSMADIDGQTGVGAGYAYMLDNDSNLAFTLAVGQSGSETAIRGGVGFEFGGERKASYVGSVESLLSEYEQKLTAVTENLRRTEEDRQAKINEIERLSETIYSNAERCKDEKDRMTEACFGGK